MSRNNHMQLDKITLVKWVDKVMEQSLTKKISSLNLGPKIYGISIPKQWKLIFNFYKYTL